MIEVTINQQKFQFPDSGTLADVLPVLQIRQADGIAIALNEIVIPRGGMGGACLAGGRQGIRDPCYAGGVETN